jgi:D-alanyl-D-alanine dipeptidase
MSRAGFTNYPKEYWHWSYGDVMWAELNNKNTAIYGVIENINLD